MELVAASKMRRAQGRAVSARPYAEKLRWVLADLAETVPFLDAQAVHPLLQRREQVQATEIILISPDRGLAGGGPTSLERRGGASGFAKKGPRGAGGRP